MGGGPVEEKATKVEEKTGYRPWWSVDKEAWKQKFAIIYKINSLKQDQDKPLPPWTDADVEKFAQENPVVGEQFKKVRQGAIYSAVGAAVGGLGTAAYSYRYSRSLGAAALTLVFGVPTSWAVTEEFANIGLGLYKFSAIDVNLKFLEWWKAKTGA